MSRNIEIKARISSIQDLLPRAQNIADGAPVVIEQDDTFFRCPNGRLKLRTLSANEAQLVFYRRPDVEGPKESFYIIATTHEPDLMRDALTHAYGTHGRVIKRRTLLMCGQTRIHLDAVQGLGDFMELEVVLRDDQTADDGTAIAQDIMARLGIDPKDQIAGAYRDLLACDV